MKKRLFILALLAAFIAVDANAQNRTYRRRGVILGGLAGAAIGAAIGDKGDNETAGALIGGAIGAVAGGTIGNQKDQRIEHNRRYHSGHYHQPGYHRIQTYRGSAQSAYPQYYQPYSAPQLSNQPPAGLEQPPAISTPEAALQPVSSEDLVNMVKSGLSEQLILQQIEILGVRRRLTVSDVIRLHRLGVSEQILNAVQRMAPASTSSEVIIEPAQSQEIPLPKTLGPSIVTPSNGK